MSDITDKIRKVKAEETTMNEPKIMPQDAVEKALYLKAIAKQEEIKKAPDMYLSEDSYDEYLELQKIYLPESIDKVEKPATIHAFWGRNKEMAMDIQKGYVPVLDGSAAFVRGPGNEVLYSLDYKIFKARELAQHMESRKRSKSKHSLLKSEHQKIEQLEEIKGG